MLSINREMGFKHVLTVYDWQVDVGRVFEYLAGRQAMVCPSGPE